MIRVLPILSFALAACALAADWPQWRGPNRDGAAVGVTLPQTWPKTLKETWRVDVGEGLSSPVVVGNRIYIHARRQGDEAVSCLDLADGKTVWNGRYPAPWKVQPGAGDDRGGDYLRPGVLGRPHPHAGLGRAEDAANGRVASPQ